MEIIISIAAVLLIVSLYDYFTSKGWQQITSSSRNNVVFDERNKEYGAYEIRRNYDKSMVFILLGVVATIGVSYGAYLFTQSIPVEEEKLSYDDTPVVFEFPEDEKIEEIELNIIDEVAVEKLEEQLSFRLFEITDIDVNTTISTQEQVEEVRAGEKNQIGDDEPTFEVPTNISKIGISDGTEDDDGNTVAPFVDEDAEFTGGRTEMFKFFNKNLKYPEIAAIANISGQAKVRFIVEKNGNISDVKVVKGVPNCSECDTEAVRVVKAMPPWKPGKINGRPVRSYFHMPITFSLK